MMKLTIRTLALAGALLVIPQAASYGNAHEAENRDRRVWEFTAEPYLWIPEVHGSASLGRLKSSVDVDFGDLFELLGDGDLWSGAGHFEVRNRDLNLTLFVDAFGVMMETDENPPGRRVTTPVGTLSVPSGKADLNLDLAIIEFGVGYRLPELRFPNHDGRSLWIEPIVGGRYLHTYADADVSIGRVRLGGELTGDLVDPFVGGRWQIDLLDGLTFRFRGDIGGFDVETKLTWGLTTLLHYRLPWTLCGAPMSAGAGYKILDFDWKKDSGGRFDLDRQLKLNFRGPILGFGFVFS